MLSSETSVSSNLFRGGGNEIFQELPKCDTDRKGENAVGKLAPKRLAQHRVTTDL